MKFLIVILCAVLFCSCMSTDRTYIEPFRVEGISSNGMYNKKYKVDLIENAGMPRGEAGNSKFSIYTDSISYTVGDIIYIKKIY